MQEDDGNSFNRGEERVKRDPDQNTENSVNSDLEWRDYIALVAGLSQTVLLPFLVAFIVLLLLTIAALIFL